MTLYKCPIGNCRRKNLTFLQFLAHSKIHIRTAELGLKLVGKRNFLKSMKGLV